MITSLVTVREDRGKLIQNRANGRTLPWKTASGPATLKRVQHGATRWWLKQVGRERVLGSFVILLQVLQCIKVSPKFDSKVTFKANALLKKWCTFNNLLTGILLLDVLYTASYRLLLNTCRLGARFIYLSA